jgi:two-component system, NarL family, response regulator NreC
MPSFILADDHAVLRQGLKAILTQNPDWHVIAEAGNGLELMEKCRENRPDIIILDLSMPQLGGLEALNRLQKEYPETSVVVLTAKEDELSVSVAMKHGAQAYVAKTSSSEELQFAIHAILKGQRYVSPTVCGGLLKANEDTSGAFGNLSMREREIMKLLCEGQPNRTIAKLLHISPRTVDSHRANILKKLNVNSNVELVQVGIRYGIIEQ